MIPTAALLGRPLILTKTRTIARPAACQIMIQSVILNDGYDEVQVYWSIDTLFESLHAMGFEDPELSTRPFNAFLYDPDIESRDNAF